MARNVFVLQGLDSGVDLTRVLSAQQWQVRRATRNGDSSAALQDKKVRVAGSPNQGRLPSRPQADLADGNSSGLPHKKLLIDSLRPFSRGIDRRETHPRHQGR